MSRARRLGALLTGLAVVLAGCSSATRGSGAAAPASNPITTPAPTASDPAPSSPAGPPSSATPATSTAAPTVQSTGATSSTPAPPAAPRSTCTQVGIRVIRGSAAPGREVAALQFTNDGAQPCRLVGYPRVTLLLGGKVIGTPSQPESSAGSERTLAPGDTAESLLSDYTDCQAPLSDNVRVVVPGSTLSAVRPAQLRACTVRVAKLGAPD